MEDALYYIGLGLLITFSLIRKAGKAASKKSAKRVNMPPTIPTEAFPPIIPTYTYKEISDTQTPKVEKYEQKMEVEQTAEMQSLETIIDEEEVYMREQAKAEARASMQSNAKKSLKQTTSAATPTPKVAKNGKNSVISEDFDLREAVIYSELLKPKFEE